MDIFSMKSIILLEGIPYNFQYYTHVHVHTPGCTHVHRIPVHCTRYTCTIVHVHWSNVVDKLGDVVVGSL